MTTVWKLEDRQATCQANVLGDAPVEQVVLLLAGAACARGCTANQKGCAAGDDSLSPVGIEMGEAPQNILQMKKPHGPILVFVDKCVTFTRPAGIATQKHAVTFLDDTAN